MGETGSLPFHSVHPILTASHPRQTISQPKHHTTLHQNVMNNFLATLLALTSILFMSPSPTTADSPLEACCHHWECPKYHLCCHDDRIGEGRAGVCRLVDEDPNVCARPFNSEESIVVSMNCCLDASCPAGEQCSWQETGIPSRCM